MCFFSYQVMLLCWKENPNDRPTFTKLKGKMQEMEKNHRVRFFLIEALFFVLFHMLGHGRGKIA